MRDRVTVLAPAKLNLALDVVGILPGGYHALDMTMQAISLYERVVIRRSPYLDLALPGSNVKPGPGNTAIKAALAFFHYTGLLAGADITIYKSVPVRAGMAGGSTDAASCMLALNDLYELGLSKRQLMKRGVRLGADIPYCILKGTALSEGIGEKISTIPKMPDCYVLICKPGIHVSTGFVYTNLVLDENTPHPDIDYMITCMKKKDLKTLCQNLGNVLETVTIPAHPEIAKIKETMMQEGALGSLMSGSGPTVFGIFDDLDKAKAAKAVCRKLPFKCFAFVTDLYR